MVVETVGVCAFLLGLMGVFFGARWSITLLVLSTLLQAAAAVTLPGLGSASIPPAHLLLGMLILILFAQKPYRARVTEACAPGEPGFWLLVAVVYGVLSAFLMPRLFAGWTEVYALSRNAVIPAIVLVPLDTSTGNFTQSIYLVGDLFCFVCFYCFASAGTRERQILARAGLACGVTNLLFAFLDLTTQGSSELLSLVRNANYTMLNEATMGGAKRIVGSFTEASGYAYMTLGLFTFSVEFWLRGTYRLSSGIVAGASLLTLLMSTSSTAYAGLFVVVMILYVRSVAELANGDASPQVFHLVVAAPMIIVAAFLILSVSPTLSSFVQEIFDEALLNKLATDSGLERARWNGQALTNLFDTFGFGVGLGSTRASTFVLAALSNLGLIGTALLSVFTYQALQPVVWRSGPSRDALSQAAGSTCLAYLVAATVSGGMVDLGLPFFMFAGVASARRERRVDRGEITPALDFAHTIQFRPRTSYSRLRSR